MVDGIFLSNLIIYITILIFGTVFGSFFTLAVHRIPKGQDITHERSYCPNCNHKLQFLDLIPVFSYIFLGGKCRYCKKKIRPRYLILEICSGILFVSLAFSNNISVLSSVEVMIKFALEILFLCACIITAGIDKEYYKTIDGVLIYGLIIGSFRVVFNGIFDIPVVSNIVGFIAVPLILYTLFRAIIEKSSNSFVKECIKLDYIKYLSILGLFLDFKLQVLSFLISFVFMTVYYLFQKRNQNEIKVPGAFLMTIVFVIAMIVFNIM